MSDDALYLIQILERVLRIEEFTREGQAAFSNSLMVQDAVIRNFEVIGEVAKRVTEDVKQEHPQIPWRRVAGFRDVLIHGYDRVDVDEVWTVIERDLPMLRREIEAALRARGVDPGLAGSPAQD